MKEIKLKGLDETIYTETLANGLEIYIWKNAKINTFMASYVVKCGGEDVAFQVNKKKKSVPYGTAHYLEHILCKDENGTSYLPKFNALGSYSNASTYPDKTSFEVVGTECVKENLNLLLDEVQEKIFNEEYFEKERGPILEEARMRKDDISRIILYEIQNCLYSVYPNRISGLGTMEDIENMKLDSLKLFYDTFYHPKNSFLIVTGNVLPIEVISIVKENQKQKTFAKWIEPKMEKYKEPKKVPVKYKEISLNVEIPQVYMTAKIPKKVFQEYDEIYLIDVLSLVLISNFGSTSLFKEELVQKKLVLSLGSYATVEKDYVILQVSARTKYPDELVPILKQRFTHLELDEKDIKRKIKSEIANLVLNYEEAETVNEILTYSLSKYGKIIQNEKEILESICFEDVQKIIEKASMKEMNTLVVRQDVK